MALNIDTREELIKLKEKTGFSWKKLADYYRILYRTIQDWYMGKRNMPDYLLRLMIYKFDMKTISDYARVYISSTKNSKKIRTRRNKWKNHTG